TACSLKGETRQAASLRIRKAVTMRSTRHGGPNPGLARGGCKISCPRCEPESFPIRVSRAEQGRAMGAPLPMEYQDKVLKCIDCGTDFVFTAGEQLFFHDKQFKNEPKRCKNCKGKRVAVLGATSHSSSRGHSYAKTETRTNCSQCGK